MLIFLSPSPWVVFFITAALLVLEIARQNGKLKYFMLTGLLLGLAMACKLSVFSFALLVLLVVIDRAAYERSLVGTANFRTRLTVSWLERRRGLCCFPAGASRMRSVARPFGVLCRLRAGWPIWARSVD